MGPKYIKLETTNTRARKYKLKKEREARISNVKLLQWSNNKLLEQFTKLGCGNPNN